MNRGTYKSMLQNYNNEISKNDELIVKCDKLLKLCNTPYTKAIVEKTKENYEEKGNALRQSKTLLYIEQKAF